MKYLLTFFLFIKILYATEVSAFVAVNLSYDAYSTPQEFYKKYKTSTNSINSYIYKRVRYYTIEDKQNIYIVFRGTSSRSNLKTDISINSVEFFDLKDSMVHEGFFDIAKKCYINLQDKISKNKPIIITGHSLGGAVSLLLGSIYYTHNRKDISIYSFGAPPVGNDIFVDSIKDLKHYRYKHILDIIPNLNKKVAKKLTKAIKLVIQSNKDSFLLPVYNLLKDINYNYIHQNYKVITLTKKVTTPKKYKELPFLARVVLTPLKYHSIEGYKEAIKR